MTDQATTTVSELLPCPFCGGEGAYQTDTEEDTFSEEWIGCTNCGATAAIEVWNRRATADMTEAMVGQAMQDAWDEICSDTGCHPLDIERQGKSLFFHPNHWARFVAMRVLAALNPPMGR